MSKSEPILALLGVAARGAYDRAEASSTAKAASETQANFKQWGAADGALSRKAEDAIEDAETVYENFNMARDVNHKADLAAIVVMAGDVTGDVSELIVNDNQLDILLGQREAAYDAEWAAVGATEEGDITEFLQIFSA